MFYSVLKIILSLIVFYILLILIFYLIQGHYIYFPQYGNIDPKKWGLPKVKLIKIKTEDGLSLNVWYHPAEDQNFPTILYLHGNYGHLAHRAMVIEPYIKAGYGILVLGYRGYSGNKGKPTEKGLYADARAAINFLKKQNISTRCIILFGESLGTGIAVQMATEFHVGAVVLQSPFTSMTDVGKKHYGFLPVKWILKDRYESITKIHHIKTPLLVVHGEQDNIIPVEFGKRLYAHANQPKAIKIYSHAGHNNMPDTAPTVIQFLKKYKVCSQ